MNKRHEMANYVIVMRSLITKADQTAKCPNVFHILVDFSSILSSIKNWERNRNTPISLSLIFSTQAKCTLQSSQRFKTIYKLLQMPDLND